MPYAIRLPLVLKTVVVHLLLPAALAISLGAAGGVVHADVLPPQMQDASESAAAAEAELTQGAGDRTLHPVIRLGVLTHSPPWYDGSFVLLLMNPCGGSLGSCPSFALKPTTWERAI